MKLASDECIMIYQSLEAVTIKGKDAPRVAKLLDRFDKEIVKLLKSEGKLDKEGKVSSDNIPKPIGG